MTRDQNAQTLRIRFDKLSEALQAGNEINEKVQEWRFPCRVRFITPEDYAAAMLNGGFLNDLEGQVILGVTLDYGGQFAFDQALMETAMRAYAKRYHGDVHAIVCGDNNPSFAEVRVEFDSIKDSKTCIEALRRSSSDVFELKRQGLPSVKFQVVDAELYSTSEQRKRYDSVTEARNLARSSVPSPRRAHGSAPNNDAAPRRLSWNHHSNMVNFMRIDQGLDVRTTIMLRNIPNKMDAVSCCSPRCMNVANSFQIGLKDFIDNVGECKGMYDFIYLRIDFRTGSNVGYAFINFVCSKGMINMIRLIEGRPWEGYRSSKSAEISYATIQGTEALIQKFRNSSVMQEFPHCRPKVSDQHPVHRSIGLANWISCSGASMTLVCKTLSNSMHSLARRSPFRLQTTMQSCNDLLRTQSTKVCFRFCGGVILQYTDKKTTRPFPAY